MSGVLVKLMGMPEQHPVKPDHRVRRWQMVDFSRLPKRFRDKVSIMQNGCWEWTAAKSKGHGRFWDSQAGRIVQAHRFSYETLIGPIPQRKDLDHLCRNKPCVNPLHLEPVTRRVNCQRGDSGVPTGVLQRAKTHCPKGHPYNEENTYIRPKDPYKRRCCRACNREAVRRYKERKNGKRSL